LAGIFRKGGEIMSKYYCYMCAQNVVSNLLYYPDWADRTDLDHPKPRPYEVCCDFCRHHLLADFERESRFKALEIPEREWGSRGELEEFCWGSLQKQLPEIQHDREALGAVVERVIYRPEAA
jgi:hypothetical protein